MSLFPRLHVRQHLVTLKIICGEEQRALIVSHAHREHKAPPKNPFVFVLRIKKILIKIIFSNNKRSHHLAKNKHWKQNIETASFN